MDKTSQSLKPEKKLKYRFSVKGLVICALILSLPLLPIWLAVNKKYIQDLVFVWALGISLIGIPYIWLIVQFEIDNEGIKLYRVNLMKWADVVSAKRINILGLKYLHVTRRKGMNWSIPLYLNGPLPIEIALKEKTPTENPIHQLLTSEAQKI